jgi:hypothetical protein
VLNNTGIKSAYIDLIFIMEPKNNIRVQINLTQWA